MRIAGVFPLCCLLGLLAAAHAQQNTPPSNPKELMLAAAKLNNLETADAKPWHVKASFQFFDDLGTVSDQGAFEEFWAGPSKFKITYSGKNFSETQYGSEQGNLRAGSHGIVPGPVFVVRRDIVAPFPEDALIQKNNVDKRSIMAGATALTCLSFTSANPGAAVPTQCVMTDAPILRVASYLIPSGNFEVIRNRMLRFEDRYVPGDIQVKSYDKVVLTAHVDLLEGYSATDQAFLTPPPDAVPIPIRIVDGKAAGAMIVRKVAPEYPPAAKAAHISGTVDLDAIIDANGKVKSLDVLSGPEPLRDAAVAAVKQWQYKPFLMNGKPVEVEILVHVMFFLPR